MTEKEYSFKMRKMELLCLFTFGYLFNQIETTSVNEHAAMAKDIKWVEEYKNKA